VTTRSYYKITGEVNKSERDIKDGGSPHGDRRRRKRRGVREVNNEGEGSYREILIRSTVVSVQRRKRETRGSTKHVGQVYIRREYGGRQGESMQKGN